MIDCRLNKKKTLILKKASHQSITSHETAHLLRLATYASVSVALALILMKLIAWGLSHSISLMATLVDSVLDAIASIINLIAVRHALTPADKEHRFGHGKAEALAGLCQSMFIAGSAGFLLFEVTHHIFNPIQIKHASISIAIMVLSTVATLCLVIFQHYVVKKTQSTAIRADALHYKSDLLANGGVILALWLSLNGMHKADVIIGGLIALYILHSAWEIVRSAFDQLMDRELPDGVRTLILQLAIQHPLVQGVHDLRTRHAGTSVFIQFHLELEDSLSLIEAHTISDEVEARLKEAFPDSEIIIHMDPNSVVGHEIKDQFH